MLTFIKQPAEFIGCRGDHMIGLCQYYIYIYIFIHIMPYKPINKIVSLSNLSRVTVVCEVKNILCTLKGFPSTP